MMEHLILSTDEAVDITIVTRRRRGRRRCNVRFGVPYLSPVDHPHRRSPLTIKIPNDAIAAVPLIFTDQEGHALAGSNSGNVSVEVADTSVASVTLTSDAQWVQITPLVASGNSSVTYRDADDNITASLDFSIVVPTPVSAAFNEGAAVLTPNPNPPQGAPGSTITGGAAGGGVDTTGGAGSVSGAGSVGGGTDTTGGGASSVAGGAG